jgi:hypothetical protein
MNLTSNPDSRRPDPARPPIPQGRLYYAEGLGGFTFREQPIYSCHGLSSCVRRHWRFEDDHPRFRDFQTGGELSIKFPTDKMSNKVLDAGKISRMG